MMINYKSRLAAWLSGTTSVFSCGGLSLKYIRLIYGWPVITLWVKCPLWVNQRGHLSLSSLRCRYMGSPCNYMDYGGGDH